jgi:methyl-accepting chemotaxis protein
MKLRSKLVLIGIFVTLLPLSLLLFTVFDQNSKVVQVGEEQSLQLAYADLEHIVDNLYTLAESHQEVTQNNLASALNVAKDQIDRLGQVSFTGETVTWQATNQFSNATRTVTLPRMMFGDQWLGQTTRTGNSVPIVDRVQQLLDVTCTVFQRFDPQGDMLRVATNVINQEGHRAIGTYIPATHPNGGNNPVVAAVLRGETYTGRAFVVNAWYITSYAPLYDAERTVVGMLYVGIPQENVTSLRRAIMDMKIGQTGYVTVLDSTGSLIISQQGQQDGINIAAQTDAEGRPYIQERLTSATTLSPRAAGNQQFLVRNQAGQTVLREARYVYFQPWDWIITAEANQTEFTRASALITEMNRRGTMILAMVSLGAVLLTVAVWLFMANRIVKPINMAVAGLKDVAEGDGDLTKRLVSQGDSELKALAHWFNTFLEKLEEIVRRITENSNNVGEAAIKLTDIAGYMASGAGETSQSAQNVSVAAEEMSANLNAVAAAMEQSTTNTSMVASASEEMSVTINQIANNAETANATSRDAVHQAKNAGAKMAVLGQAAQAIGKVTETITEISEQINLLALNATIEAARAGEAGKGFAVVANEIKELAKQTATATLDIKEQISDIQNTTETTRLEIDAISSVIENVNDIVAAIAASVSEQSTATQEIADNISQVSLGIQEVNENVSQSSAVATQIAQDITTVNTSTEKISHSSTEVKDSAETLRQMATDLNAIVGRFKTS